MSMVSVVIPVLNEEKALPNTLGSVFEQSGLYEVIVVDGGSNDKTRQIAESFAEVTLIQAKRGRASQMNAGADIAKGDWILFLHADTILPHRALEKISSLKTAAAGCFHQSFSGGHFLLRLISWLHNWRCSRSRIIYGDQAMFIKRELFFEIGKFPEQDILEDVLISEKLVRVTRPAILDDEVITDSRKFIQRGVIRSFIEVFIIMSCYELRLPILGRSFFSPVR